MNVIKFDVNDELHLKKKHPCGNDIFTVLRGGTDVRVVCNGCGRDMLFERTALEKNIKKVIKNENK